jgi:aldehyde dehydrogenase (NAD+)
VNPVKQASAAGQVQHDRLYIGGEWVEPADGRLIDVINPLTEEPIGRAGLGGPPDLDRAVRAARQAFDSGPWASSTVQERAAIMTRAGDLIAERAEEFTRTITLEVGSPLAIAAAQPPICKVFLDWHAAQASTFPWEEEREGIMGPLLVRRQPVGVVGAIVPWNFPLALSFPKLAPALLTGCSVILKPPEETPLFGFLLAQVFEEAGLPAGVLNVVPADREVSEGLVTHPLVDRISFTGSTRAGRRIASLCGDQIKRCSLELGGKSAAIVLPDADLNTVIPALAPTTMVNNGQTCVNQTRVLAHRDRYDDVVEALREAIGAFEIGDPADPSVYIGPLVTDVQRERVEGYIAKGRDEGARLVLGGGRPDRDRGYFVEPTIFADVDNKMTIAQEEIFGPVVAVIPYGDEDEAVAIANDSNYGLSGSVWGPDVEHAKEVARRVRSGNVAINQHTLDIGGPFGGFKQSGLGREYGLEGIDEYVEIQSIPYLRDAVLGMQQ